MAVNTLSQNIQRVITDLTNIKTAITEKGVTVPPGTPTNGYSELITGIESGGGNVELNIHYGDLAPEDTTKLWIKTNEPENIKIDNEITSVVNGSFSAPSVNVPPSGSTVTGKSLCVERVNNMAYLFGGSQSLGILAYNLETGATVLTGTNLPYSDLKDAITGRVDNSIYFMGGVAGLLAYNGILRYDVTENTLSTIPKTMPSDCGRRGAGFVTIGTKIYIFGGYNSTTTSTSALTKTAYVFDTETYIFTRLGTMPTAKGSFMSCVVIDHNIYLYGGLTSTGSASSSIVKYDALLNIYTAVASLPLTTSVCRAANIGSDVYIFNLSIIYKHDTITNSVTTIISSSPWSYDSGFAISFGTDIFYFRGALDTGVVKTITEVELPTGHLLISTIKNGFKVSLLNTGGINLALPVSDVFLGDANNKAQKVAGYYFNNNQWNLI